MTRTEKQAGWRGHIETLESSGQSQSDYCEQQGLKLATFSYWRTRFLRERLADEIDATEPGAFIAVTPSPFSSVAGSSEVQASIDYGSIRLTLPVSHLPQALPFLEGLSQRGL